MADTQDVADRALIRKAMAYRSGPDSCNSFYMGSMAIAGLMHILGLEYGRPGFDAALDSADRPTLDRLLEACKPYIEHMQANPDPSPVPGWKLVPTVLHDDMAAVLHGAVRAFMTGESEKLDFAEVWDAMLAKAPAFGVGDVKSPLSDKVRALIESYGEAEQEVAYRGERGPDRKHKWAQAERDRVLALLLATVLPVDEKPAPRTVSQETFERVYFALEELIECAGLRGDNELPNPCDDPKLWTSRMQEAWSEGQAALDETSELAEEPHKCIACDKVVKPGDLVIEDITEGAMHAECCGPERESYVTWDGEPLPDGVPIPTGHPYLPYKPTPDEVDAAEWRALEREYDAYVASVS